MNKIVWNKEDGRQIILDKTDIDPIAKTFMISWTQTETPPPELHDGQTVHWENDEWVITEVPLPFLYEGQTAHWENNKWVVVDSEEVNEESSENI